MPIPPEMMKDPIASRFDKYLKNEQVMGNPLTKVLSRMSVILSDHLATDLGTHLPEDVAKQQAMTLLVGIILAQQPKELRRTIMVDADRNLESVSALFELFNKLAPIVDPKKDD